MVTAHIIYKGVLKPSEKLSVPAQKAPIKVRPNLIKNRFWYKQLGYLRIKRLQKTALMVKGINIKAKELIKHPYNTCDLTKSFKYYNRGYLPCAKKALQVLHLDNFQIKPITLSGIK